MKKKKIQKIKPRYSSHPRVNRILEEGRGGEREVEGGEGNLGEETCNGESAFLADGGVADDSGNWSGRRWKRS